MTYRNTKAPNTKIMAERSSESDDGDGWTKVVSRKHRNPRPQPPSETKLRAVKQYWDGFDEQNQERWFIELSNGTILSNTDKDYSFWAKRYYPNRK